MLQLPDLEQKLTVTTQNGEVLKICLGLMLFFEHEELQEKRNSILSLIEKYSKFVGNIYRWTLNPQTCNWKYLNKGSKSYIEPKDWLLDSSPYEMHDILYHAGEASSDASNVELFVHYSKINLMLFQFPVEAFANADIGMPKLAQEWCSILRPEHGYGGFCLGRSHGYEFESSSYEYQLAQCYPGIDVRNPQLHCLSLKDSIKGADWLVILSDKYLEKLGGKKIVKKSMGQMPMLEYPGGAVLQAGVTPQLGDREGNDEQLTEYRKIAAIIEPIRNKNHIGMHIGNAPTPCFTKKSYQEWLARFSPIAG